MGLDINSVWFLLEAHRKGIRWAEVLTVGRQILNVFPAKMVQVLQADQLPCDVFKSDESKSLYAEPVFKSLGAQQVSSMDISAFEGAEFIHDLNVPIPGHLKQRFDLVFDGGTLEHIFHFPTALKNCMEMVKEGGHLIIHNVINNYCGHGFYQFSPELFYRALSKENGFQVERVVIHRIGPYGRWYEVTDPEKIRSRVELMTFSPWQILVLARRTTIGPIFEKPPQQSDYVPRWEEFSPGAKAVEPPSVVVEYKPARPGLARFLPGLARLVHVARMGLRLYYNESLWNRKCFRPVKKG